MATTTINTIEDLMRVLDEHPQWLEAMRVRLLTRELLELPALVERLAHSVDQRFEHADAVFKSIDERFDQVDARFKAVDERFDQVDARFKAVDERFDQVDARFDRLEGRMDRQESNLEALRQDIAPLKAVYARDVAVLQSDLIAGHFGLKLVKALTREEVAELTRSWDVSDMPLNELISFRGADLVLDAVDASGAPCYVVGEVSYTLDERDTARAMRNVGILTRFTGRPAHAAVAGLRVDDHIRDVVASGEVYWHQLSDEALKVRVD